MYKTNLASTISHQLADSHMIQIINQVKFYFPHVTILPYVQGFQECTFHSYSQLLYPFKHSMIARFAYCPKKAPKDQPLDLSIIKKLLCQRSNVSLIKRGRTQDISNKVKTRDYRLGVQSQCRRMCSTDSKSCLQRQHLIYHRSTPLHKLLKCEFLPKPPLKQRNKLQMMP